jgi:hypothetical protein
MFVDVGPKGVAQSHATCDTVLDSCRLLDSGHVPSKQRRQEIKASLCVYVTQTGLHGWTCSDVTAAAQATGVRAPLLYKRAECEGEMIGSRDYKRSRTRPNYWVIKYYHTDAAGEEPYVGRINYFVKLQHPQVTGRSCRFAIADLWKPAESGKLLVVSNITLPTWHNYAIPLDQLNRKLCCAYPDGYLQGTMSFMTYLNATQR